MLNVQCDEPLPKPNAVIKTTILYDGVEFEIEYEVNDNQITIEDIRSEGDLWEFLSDMAHDNIYIQVERAHVDRESDQADIQANL